MSRPVLIDLDNADAADLDRLWQEINSRHASRRADPILYDALALRIEHLKQQGKLSRAQYDEIRAELSTGHPAAVLSAHWRALIPDQRTVGHYLHNEVPIAA